MIEHSEIIIKIRWFVQCQWTETISLFLEKRCLDFCWQQCLMCVEVIKRVHQAYKNAVPLKIRINIQLSVNSWNEN